MTASSTQVLARGSGRIGGGVFIGGCGQHDSKTPPTQIPPRLIPTRYRANGNVNV